MSPDDSTDAVLRRAAEKMAEIKDKKAAEYAAWAADAQEAWDSGQHFYLPTITAYADRDNDHPRAKDAEQILAAIVSVGWHLHTWASETAIRGLSYAHPLFVRELEAKS